MTSQEKRKIQFRKTKLEDTRTKLKENFIGIYEQIDKIIDSIETWYCYPEFCIRPTVINLWGLPGCGKTDLVNKMVGMLGLENKFCNINLNSTTSDESLSFRKQESNEMYLGNKSDYRTATIIESMSSCFSMRDQGVLFIDEFHRFNDKAESKSYRDLWTLLSDGKIFSTNSIINWLEDTIETMDYKYGSLVEDSIQEFYNQKDKNSNKNDEESPFMKKIKALSSKLQWNDVNIFCTLFTLTESEKETIVDDFRQFNLLKLDSENFIGYAMAYFDEEIQNTKVSVDTPDRILLRHAPYKTQKKILNSKLKILREKLELADNYQEITELDDEFCYSKLLIILCGNIVLNEGEELSQDLLIQKMYNTFREEYVSRLGTNLIYYPPFKAEDYEKVRIRIVQGYIAKMKKKYGIKFSINIDKINEKYPIDGYIKNNKRGMRQVYSDTMNYVSELIPKLLIEKLDSE